MTPINITSPRAGASWRTGSTQSINWTMNPAVSAGEFRVGLVNAAGTTTFINKQVLPAPAKTAYSAGFAASVTAAPGYRAFVWYRPTVGTGTWTATAKSAAFTVTL